MMTSLHSNPGIIRVANVMVPSPTVVGFWTPLREAAKLLERGRTDALLVMHDDGRLAGLLSERDLVLGAQAEAEGMPGRSGHYANRRFVLTHEDEALEALLRRMVVHGVRRAVVLDEEETPIGLVSVLMGIPMRGPAPHTSGRSMKPGSAHKPGFSTGALPPAQAARAAQS
jgi:predicted transcriptional regulator